MRNNKAILSIMGSMGNTTEFSNYFEQSKSINKYLDIISAF